MLRFGVGDFWGKSEEMVLQEMGMEGRKDRSIEAAKGNLLEKSLCRYICAKDFKARSSWIQVRSKSDGKCS